MHYWQTMVSPLVVTEIYFPVFVNQSQESYR